MDAYDWKCLTFADRDDIILDRMAERGIDPRRFDAQLHDLADAWRIYIANRLCGEDGDGAATDAKDSLAAIDDICAEIGLPSYGSGVDGDALDVAHTLTIQAYSRR